MNRQLAELLKRNVRLILVSALVVVMLLTLLPTTLAHFLNPVQTKAAGPNPIQVENSLPGDPTWNDFNAPAQPDTLSGYGSKISVNHGDSIDFFVTTTDPSFTINIYRTGWYNSAGARLVTSLGSFTGVHQAIPNPDPVTGIIACNWAKTTTLTIPSTWVSGVYLARLNAPNGDKSFIFFVVRNDGGNEDLLFQTSVTTYQAYNTWGGTSLYNNNTNKSIYSGPHATKVSFDRPFNPGDSNGAGHYFFYEFKMVYWLESQGYNVAYSTNVDTEANGSLLKNHKGFLSVGHDEYWSKGMRDNVQAAINAGVNVAFFSANSMYWQIRFEANAAGSPNRVEVGYKDYATDTTPPGPDPQWHHNDAIVTTNFRASPVNNPENALIGVMFEDQVGQNFSYIVQNASSWVYAGTGFVNGSAVPGIVGYEYDRIFNNGSTPAGLTVLSNSPVIGVSAGNSFSNSSLYTAASGARVFASGTIQWSWGLANVQSNTFMNAGIQRMTTNILNNFINGTGPTVGLNPTSVNFGNQFVGSTSGAQTVTLSNSGSAPLSFSAIAIAGTNASDFAQSNTCPTGATTLAPGASCTISVTFTPGVLGARSANLTFTDNASDSPQAVTLSGTGATAAPAVSLNPTTINFGNQNAGSGSPAQTVTLTNSGTTPLSISNIALTGTNASDYAQTNTCPTGSNTLAANASCTISVTFAPGSVGASSASLTFTDNAPGSPQAVTLNGTGISATTYFNDGFESGNLNAWTLPSSDSTGTRAAQSAVVNSGSNALAFTNTSGQYGYVYTALPSGPQAQTFTRFYFRFASNVTNGTQLALGRNSNGGNAFEVDFNAGRHGLDVYVWNGTGGVYSIFSPNNALSPNTWYSIEVQDFQTSEGIAQAWINGASIGLVEDVDLSTSTPYARLMLFDSAPGTAYIDDVRVSNIYNGTVAPAPGVNLNPTSVNFGNQNTGSTSSVHSISLTNNGTLPLSISNIALTGTNAADFAQTNTCPTGSNTLAANASCTISLTFTPGASGTRSANLTFTDNASDSPQAVALSGTGVTVAPAVTLNPTSVSFGNQKLGSTSATQTVTLSNSGSAALSISTIALTGTNAADFAQTNTCPSGSNTLAANASCTISLTFTPGATGARSANLTFTDNAPGSPQAVALSGTGVITTTYFNDGFESGNLSAWTLPSSDSTGTRAVQSVVVNSGSNALALTNASGQYDYVYTALPSGPQAQTFTRFYFRFPSNVTNGTQLAIGRNNNGGNSFEVDFNAGRHGLDVYIWNGSGGVYSIFSPNNALSPDTWYSIEVQDYQTSTGHAQAWINGASIGSVDADLSTASPYARLMLFDSAPGTIYIDDVNVYNISTNTPTPAVTLNPTSVNFGNQNTGSTSSAHSVTLTNSGTGPLSISNIALTGTNAADFAQTNTCPSGSNTLAANASCTISLTFTPGASGARSANLTFTDTASDSPQAVALSGTGVTAAPAVTLNPTSVSFGNQNVGTGSTAHSITLTNSGTSPLSISNIALTGTNAADFAQTNTCPTGSNTLAANASCTISLTFTPGATGARSANLTFTDTASDSPQTVALSGAGVNTTTYFNDGFESGNLNAWTLPNSDSTGTATVQSAVVNSGSNALALTNASGQYSYVYTALPSGPQAQTFTRFYFRFASNVTNGTQLAIGRNSNGGNAFEIDFNAGRHGLDVYIWNGSGGVYSIFSPNNALSPDTWYSIELQDYQTSTGHAQAWINGASIGSVDADLSTASPYARLMLFDSAPGAIYIDDVRVSNT